MTVIVRSMGRASLVQALDSIARQTYPRIEIVLVDATGGRHPVVAERCGTATVRLIGTQTPLNRPQAANYGLDHACGEWLIFLDDDDFYDATHVASLLSAARQKSCSVAHSGTRVLDDDGRYVCELNRPYAPLAVLEKNYIQMGSVLFHRRLLDLGCRFDEELLLFQDWDFWLQLGKHTAFAHTNAVTTNWRAFSGQSGAGVGGNLDAELQARFARRLKEKWSGTRRRLIAFVGNVGRHATWLISHRYTGRAISLLGVALAIAPDDPGLLNLLGVALYSAGQVADAHRALSKAHALFPDNASIRRNLALVQRES